MDGILFAKILPWYKEHIRGPHLPFEHLEEELKCKPGWPPIGNCKNNDTKIGKYLDNFPLLFCYIVWYVHLVFENLEFVFSPLLLVIILFCLCLHEFFNCRNRWLNQIRHSMDPKRVSKIISKGQIL